MELGDTDWLAALVRSAAGTLNGIVCIEGVDRSP
jgi:hypothetical protein